MTLDFFNGERCKPLMLVEAHEVKAHSENWTPCITSAEDAAVLKNIFEAHHTIETCTSAPDGP